MSQTGTISDVPSRNADAIAANDQFLFRDVSAGIHAKTTSVELAKVVIANGAEATANKNQANGYAGINADGQIVGPIMIPTYANNAAAGVLAVGELGFVATDLRRGDGATTGGVPVAAPEAGVQYKYVTLGSGDSWTKQVTLDSGYPRGVIAIFSDLVAWEPYDEANEESPDPSTVAMIEILVNGTLPLGYELTIIGDIINGIPITIASGFGGGDETFLEVSADVNTAVYTFVYAGSWFCKSVRKPIGYWPYT